MEDIVISSIQTIYKQNDITFLGERETSTLFINSDFVLCNLNKEKCFFCFILEKREKLFRAENISQRCTIRIL